MRARPNALTAALVMAALFVTLAPRAASAQALTPVGLDGLPERYQQLETLRTGDLLMLAPPREQQRGQPMSRLLVSSTLYQLDPIVFGNPSWANLRIDHASASASQTLWAIGDESVVYQRAGERWKMIALPELNRSSCRAWEELGSPCQLIIPVGEERAVALRPAVAQRKLGTEVLAIQQGELRPLGSIVLPGVALGPAVDDGEGGFWVMLRRTERTSNYKPMRGYLHYTADGRWLMWSDSGEVVAGTDLVARAKFLIDPSARKMTRDGRGGFFAIGRDRTIYRVASGGEAAAFSTAQPMCQYCQPLAIDYDANTDELHLVMGEWSLGEAGQIDEQGPLRWLRFDAKSGALVRDEVVPLPEIDKRRLRQFYDELDVEAGLQGAWISAPRMLLHRDARSWAWLVESSRATAATVELDAQKRRARANPALATAGIFGNVGVAGAGVLGAMGVARVRSPRTPGVTVYPLYTSMLAALGGWLPAMMMYPATSSDAAGAPLRWVRLGGGALATTAVVGLMTGILGDAWAHGVRAGSTSDIDLGSVDYQPGGWAAASAGAAIGTLGSMALMRLVYDYSDAPPNSPYMGLLGSAAASGLATLFYFMLSPAWSERHLQGAPN